MSVHWIGSKRKLLPFVFGKITRAFPDGVQGKKFLDICAGSGHISREAAERGFNVYSNDMMHTSACILNGSVGISPKTIEDASTHIAKMNASKGIRGFFYRHYSPAGGRMFFTEQNAKRIDFCRQHIEGTSGEIKDYLMYCALSALSRIQNTSGHQYSYLKSFKSIASKPMVVRAEAVSDGNLSMLTGNIFDVLREGKIPEVEVAYIDPPYNSRQYGNVYHLYETFVRNDKPDIYGETGLRDWKKDTKSEFCSKTKCLEFMKDVISMVPAPKVFMSYSSDGIVSREDIEEGLSSLGCCRDVVTHQMAQKRFKHSSHAVNTSQLYEYLFEITKA